MKDFPEGRRAVLFLPVAAALAAGCIETRQVVPGPAALLPSVHEVRITPEDARPYTGLRLESVVSGSLIELSFEPGLSVAAVAVGSPGEAAGIRAGDRIVKADGSAVDTVDRWEAMLAQRPGEPLKLEVERGGGVSDVLLQPVVRGRGTLEPSRFAERLKSRVVLRTVPRDDGAGFCAEIVELLAESPLAEEGLAEGARIVALDGVEVGSARELAEAFAMRDFGEDVELTVADATRPREVEVELFDPPRRLTALGLPIVFGWRRDIEAEETSLRIVDFWLFAIYEWKREGETRRHRLFGATVYESGVGELREATEEEVR